MNVTQTKFTLKYQPPRKSVLIIGRHGIGKSQVVAQSAAERSTELKKPFGFLDIRLSQREVGDIIGMPRAVETFDVTRYSYVDGKSVKVGETIKNVTINDLPTWFPTDPESYGYIFIDELDRASRDVQQAAFELVLDYRLNFHELPQGWRVVSAINADQDVYSVIQIDPALMDRFLVIWFKPTVPEWLTHAQSIGVHDAIVKYITKFSNDLDSPDKMEPMKRYPSRRSWVALSDWMKHLADNGYDALKDLDYLTLLASGEVGQTTAINFIEFIRKDYRVFSAEDILNKYSKEMDEIFTKAIVTEVTFYNKEIVAYIVGNFTKEGKAVKQLSKKQSENLLKYYKAIPKEAASGFWGQFTKEAREVATAWFQSNPEVQQYTSEMIYKDAALKATGKK